MIGRVIGVYGPRLEIQYDDRQIEAVASGKLKYGSKGVSLVAVGDYVEIIENRKNLATVERILERNSTISRPAVEREGLLQVIVANVDRLVTVGSIASPEFKPALDR